MTARRRLLPRWARILLFVALPLLELYVLVLVGQALGAGWTILLLLASAVVGAWLVRREGARTWRSLTEALAEGRMPTRELADGVLVLLGGLLLVLPGFVSDVVGLMLVLPGTRALARIGILALAGRHVLVGAAQGMAQAPTYGTTDAQRPGPGTDGPVVRGEVIDP